MIIKFKKKRGLEKTRDQKDYWDKYKYYRLDLSFDKSDYNKFSLDLLNFNNKYKDMIKNNKKKESTYKDLRDNKRRVLLKDNKSILKPI